MQVTVKGLHLDVGTALTTHAETVLGALGEKYFGGKLDATVTFTKEKSHRFLALITIRLAQGDVLEASAQGEEVYPAFDSAAEKLATRLGRYKDKLRDHHRKQDAADLHLAAYTTFDVASEAEGGNEPAVVAELETQIQSLAVSDAVMQLELRDLPFLMFKNPAHGGYNVVYRRNDGNIGWIDPDGLSSRNKDGAKRAAG